MKPAFRSPRTVVISMGVVALLGGCAREVGQAEFARATEGYVADTNKLFVVDCLLPGQVRQLGSQMTYLSQRRPIRTTAADCEVRGGEYVAYDRANAASALKVWLPRAQAGDAAAQVYVGEIFEKGLGQAVDYGAAQQWYHKAAEQGNSQAQLNLGHLYEKGLGVAADSSTAMGWYRKAAGLEGAGLQFTPAVTAAVPDSVTRTQELQLLRREAEQLRNQLQALREQVLEQQDALRNSQEELAQVQERYRQQQTTPAQSGEAQALAAELRRKEAALKAQQAQVAALAETLGKERAAAKHELEVARELAGSAKQAADADDALAEKMASYQRKSAELTQWLTGGGEGAGRDRIEQRKRELQAEARDISMLKDRAERQAAKPGAETVAGTPVIEILDPPVTVTRGLPSIQLSGTEKFRQVTGKVAARAGLASLMVNDKPVTAAADGVFRFPAQLTEASTPFRIVATDRKRQHSELVVTLVGPDAAPAPTAPIHSGGHPRGDTEFGRFHALIIGNADYAAFPKLSTPVADAKSVDVILRERYGFRTQVLINANRHAIMSALNAINKDLTENDNLLIYYAGHGEIDKASQTAYWLPVDAEAGNPANWISSQSITEFLGIMPARHIIVVADSCYSGALTGSAVAKLPDGMDESKRAKWLQIMNTRKARTVLTSGGVQPVMDEGGGGHSVFANAFLGVLRANQKVLEDFDVFRAVAGKVRTSSAAAGFSQTPLYAPLQHAGHEGSPFFFVPEA
ncbi:MAG: peptidase C14 caspase catalytic subunit p20 [Methylococcaceae bacterium]|nr:peptidase C14 caspase catalytic subunit p20 [Methylococcaceae bacterium]